MGKRARFDPISGFSMGKRMAFDPLNGAFVHDVNNIP